MSMLSLYKAARAASKPLSTASISTNAAIDHQIPTAIVKDFRNTIWEAFVARSLKHTNELPISRVIDTPHNNLNKKGTRSLDDEKDAMLRKCAREDFFKHFRMTAASRAIKRGDGIMSKYFSINGDARSTHRNEGSNAFHTELPSLIDVSTARKAREEMHRHFWTSHLGRKDSQNDIEASLPMTTRSPTFSLTNEIHHLHEHRFKLPSTLNDVYLEFGSRMDHRSRPMAITEIAKPFKIVDVNKAWSQLCGYTREEAIGSTLKELLQGPETNTAVAKNLISSLVHEHNENAEHEAVLTNYRSDGRKFKNHARVGKIKDDVGDTTHFVGVFRKLNDESSSTNCEDLYANV
ncbi:hypothetical protein ACHAXR_010306 [Thalassiosira sp. AJA248-18]